VAVIFEFHAPAGHAPHFLAVIYFFATAFADKHLTPSLLANSISGSMETVKVTFVMTLA
jgi:hypothetical protein